MGSPFYKQIEQPQTDENDYELSEETIESDPSTRNKTYTKSQSMKKLRASVTIVGGLKKNNIFKKVSERSERAFWKTSILAMKCAKWLQT